MLYDRVRVIRQDPALPGGSMQVGTCKPEWLSVSAMPVPGPATGSYEPYTIRKNVYDPTKGRRFSKLKEKGAILFSDYENSSIEIYQDLSVVEKEIAQFYRLELACASNPPTCYVGPLIKRMARWTESSDFHLLSTYLPQKGKTREAFDDEVASAVSSTRQAAYAKALNAYDLLTELGELRETTKYLMDKVRGGGTLLSRFANKDWPAWEKGRRMNAKSLMRSGDAALRKLGGRWMEYRYALMPLFYSMKDISEVMKEKAYRYQTARDKERIDLTATFESFGDTDEYLFWESQGSVTVKSATKARFDLGDMQRLISVIGMNPFRTAWELVPLSFVVDWFINVGDAITAATGIDYSSERNGWTVIREESTFKCKHHFDYYYKLELKPKTNYCGTALPGDVHLALRYYDNLVTTVKRDMYTRSTWLKAGPKIEFNPTITWKRFIDGLALSYQPTKKLLRSLK